MKFSQLRLLLATAHETESKPLRFAQFMENRKRLHEIENQVLWSNEFKVCKLNFPSAFQFAADNSDATADPTRNS
jgi:hypothetical protein